MLVQIDSKPVFNRISESFKDFKTYDRSLKLILCVNKIAKNIFYSLDWHALSKTCKAFGHTFKNVKSVLDLVRFTNNLSGLSKDPKTKAELVNMKIAANSLSLVADLSKSAYSLGDLGLYALDGLVNSGLGAIMGVTTIASSGISIGGALRNIKLDNEVKDQWRAVKSLASVDFDPYKIQLERKNDLEVQIERLENRSTEIQNQITVLQQYYPENEPRVFFLHQQKKAIDEEKGIKETELVGVDALVDDYKIKGISAQFVIETADYQLSKLSEQYLDDVLTIISKVINIATVIFNCVVYVFLPGTLIPSIILGSLGASSAGIGLYGVWKSTENERPLPQHPKFVEMKKDLEDYFAEKGFNFDIELQVIAKSIQA